MSHLENYYVLPDNVRGDHLILIDEEVHHLSRVKRHGRGDIIWAVDGEGVAYEVEITDIAKTRALGKIKQVRRRTGEPLAEVTLAQAMIKGERFDWLIEKCVEIGVRRIIPVITEKTVLKAGSGKLNRWKRIAIGAMKQSGRSILPEITEPKAFKHICAMGANCQYRLIAHQGANSRPLLIEKHRSHQMPRGIAVIGPEGGFTEFEIELAVENGFEPVSLGTRRLRAETAGILLSAIMLSQWGELC